METKLIMAALNMIVNNPDLLKKLSMPNIPFPTMGGEIFWNTIGEECGWKLQQNQLTQHVRILDENNIRRAWGSEQAMEELFRKIVK